jgi:hypothetical protein
MNTLRERAAYRLVKKLNEWKWEDFERYIDENKTIRNQPFSLRNLAKMMGISHEHVRDQIKIVTPFWTPWKKEED